MKIKGRKLIHVQQRKLTKPNVTSLKRLAKLVNPIILINKRYRIRNEKKKIVIDPAKITRDYYKQHYGN